VTVKSIFLAGLVAALATGCGERDVKLVGERIDIRAATAFENQARPLNLAALDAGARVTATATSGAPVWATDVTPGSDNAGDASGGGVSVASGMVFVTTGFGELTALDAATGREVWLGLR